MTEVTSRTEADRLRSGMWPKSRWYLTEDFLWDAVFILLYLISTPFYWIFGKIKPLLDTPSAIAWTVWENTSARDTAHVRGQVFWVKCQVRRRLTTRLMTSSSEWSAGSDWRRKDHEEGESDNNGGLGVGSISFWDFWKINLAAMGVRGNLSMIPNVT